jgi:hypothetical protein
MRAHHKKRKGGAVMPFGRGFGFRGWSPGWPYVGLGRGGLPRCRGYGGYESYGDFWDAPYAWGNPYGPPMMTAEGEREWLKRQAEFIRQEIDQIKNRISELEKK